MIMTNAGKLFLLILILLSEAASAASTRQEMPSFLQPFGHPSRGENAATSISIDLEECSIVQAAMRFVSDHDLGSGPIRKRALMSEIESRVSTAQLEAGTAACPWGEFRTRYFVPGAFVDSIGHGDGGRYASVRGVFAFASPHIGWGSCFLYKEYGEWKVAGCDMSNTQF